MEESIADALVKTADVLHWLGRYRECNALILFSRLARALNLTTLDDLEKRVQLVEMGATEHQSDAGNANQEKKT